jgi:hypothetical protein
MAQLVIGRCHDVAVRGKNEEVVVKPSSWLVLLRRVLLRKHSSWTVVQDLGGAGQVLRVQLLLPTLEAGNSSDQRSAQSRAGPLVRCSDDGELHTASRTLVTPY